MITVQIFLNNGLISEINKTHSKLEKDYKTSEAEREQLEEAVDKHRANIAQLEKAKKELNQQVGNETW